MSELGKLLPEYALSIRQPWCWAILTADKDVENRDWATRFRGPVCIHASKAMTKTDYREFFDDLRFDHLDVPSYEAMPRGGIVGVVEIVDCVTDMDSEWFFGRYGFVLRNARTVPLIPVKGELGFFRWRNNLSEGTSG